MTVREDPESNEVRALFSVVDFDGKHVLEIGSGDGRLTWRYADKAANVTAIEPFEASVQRAREEMPAHLRERVEVQHTKFEDFARRTPPGTFDLAVLSWAL